jgi:hypothetical protein
MTTDAMKTRFARRTSARVALRRISRFGIADLALLSLFAACFILALCAIQG